MLEGMGEEGLQGLEMVAFHGPERRLIRPYRGASSPHVLP
jgi:hypothetical protein